MTTSRSKSHWPPRFWSRRVLAMMATLALIVAGCSDDPSGEDPGVTVDDSTVTATTPAPSDPPTDADETEAAQDDGGSATADVQTLAIGPSDLGESFTQIPLSESEDTSPPECPAMQNLELADDVVGVAYETDDGFSQVEQRISSSSDTAAAIDQVTAIADCPDQTFTDDDVEFNLKFDSLDVTIGQGATLTGTASGFPFAGQFAAFQAGEHLVLISVVGVGGLPDGVDAAELVQLTVDRANGDVAAATDAPELTTPGEAAPTGDATEAGADGQGSRDNPLEIGATGMLGDWEVTVDEVNLAASEAIGGANEFNEDPENGNYGLVTLTATYRGDEEGQAGFDLGVTLSGADSRQYSDTDCYAVEPQPMLDEPTVENGGTVTGQFCLDYPDEAVGGDAVLFVEETLSFDDNRLFWSLP